MNRPNLEFPKASRDVPGGYSNSRVADVVKMATRKGLEPSTSGVTGRRSNQLNYRAILTSKIMKTDFSVILWQGQKESNPRHAVLETAALPAELYPYMDPFLGNEWWAFTGSNRGPAGYEPAALTN